MRDLLQDYTRECPDRMRSLHQFMATSSYAARLKPSQRVRDASEELMRRMRTNLFPDSLTATSDRWPWEDTASVTPSSPVRPTETLCCGRGRSPEKRSARTRINA